MRISFGEDIKRRDSGKHKFLNRLSIALEALGATITNKNPDIFLHIGRNYKDVKAKKTVMRVDGLILNKGQPYEKQNRKILKAINNSDAIVYQGKFCKEAYEKFLGVTKHSICIGNGASVNEFLPRDKKNFFLANCNWRPHKRLKNICESFIYALDKGIDADLVVIGKPDYNIKHPRIKYLGWVKDKTIKKLLSETIGLIHLSWLDWCPNSMVEAAVAGCPIIYSGSGGSQELGVGTGIAITDRQWDFKPCHLYKPPKLDDNEIYKAMLFLKSNNIDINRTDLDIKNVALKYISFFESLLKK